MIVDEALRSFLCDAPCAAPPNCATIIDIVTFVLFFSYSPDMHLFSNGRCSREISWNDRQMSPSCTNGVVERERATWAAKISCDAQTNGVRMRRLF